MKKIKLILAYDGSDFHGFARQRDLRTVQGTLEAILSRTLGTPIEIHGSGRTDAGVHARAQVVHFTQPFGPPAERYVYLLRRSLPRDIIPISAEEVPEHFHARFSVVKKTYRYTISRALVEDIFTFRYAWHIRDDLSVSRMKEAARHLVGEHDFTSFCAAATPVEDKRRRIYGIDFELRDEFLDIYCTGSGFLQNMVRIVVGTLVDVSTGLLSPSDIPTVLAKRDRRAAGQTAPAHGLCLWSVDYPS